MWIMWKTYPQFLWISFGSGENVDNFCLCDEWIWKKFQVQVYRCIGSLLHNFPHLSTKIVDKCGKLCKRVIFQSARVCAFMRLVGEMQSTGRINAAPTNAHYQ